MKTFFTVRWEQFNALMLMFDKPLTVGSSDLLLDCDPKMVIVQIMESLQW